jgi:UDPglucose 6-dehydrogenase
MKVSVIGLGHVGLVTAGALARWGHDVIGYDVDADEDRPPRGRVDPVLRAGLQELIAEATEAGRFKATPELKDALVDAEVAFVCVGTPPLPGGGPNLSYVEKVGRAVAQHATNDIVLVEKSTVPGQHRPPPRADDRPRAAAHGQRPPDRRRVEPGVPQGGLRRPGHAPPRPDRVRHVVPRAREAPAWIYRTVVEEDGCPVVETDVASAELIKHASNAFLATRISFMNAVAQICDRVGADVEEIAGGWASTPGSGRRS